MSAIPHLNRKMLTAVPMLSLYGMGVLLLVLFSTFRQILPSLSRSDKQAGKQNRQPPSSVANASTINGSIADQDSFAGGGLLAAATYRGGKEHNEDSYFYEDFGPFKALAVADGVSSSQYAKTASYQLTQALQKSLYAISTQDDAVPDRQLVTEACKQAAQQIAGQLPENSRAESTLIVLFEFSDRFLVFYLGDGGVMRVRGNRRDGKSLLLAHHEEYGLLSGFVGATGPSLPTLSSIEFSKSPLPDGDIILIGTDGALPQRQEFRHAIALINELFIRGEERGRALTSAEINLEIASYLKSCEPQDNATLGILFSKEALAHWQQQLSQHSTQQGGGSDGKTNGAVVDSAQLYI